MFVWCELDTKTVLKRLRILVIPFAVTFLISVIYVLYQSLLGYSFKFFTGYGLFFELTSSGLKLFGDLLVPVVTGTTVFMALLFISSLVPIFVIPPFTNFFICPFVEVRGFENYGKVCEGITFIFQGSKRVKLFAAAFTLTIILACLFLSLWFLSGLGILAVNLSFSRFLGLLFVSNFLAALYFGFRIERALKNYVETAQK